MRSTSFLTLTLKSPPLPDVPMSPPPVNVSFNLPPDIPILSIEVLAAACLVGSTGAGVERAIGVNLHDRIGVVDTILEKVGRDDGVCVIYVCRYQ